VSVNKLCFIVAASFESSDKDILEVMSVNVFVDYG